LKQSQHTTCPEKILTQEECEIGSPSRPEEGLSPRRKRFFKGSEYNRQKKETEPGAQKNEWEAHNQRFIALELLLTTLPVCFASATKLVD
jgi:hypothetical protein